MREALEVANSSYRFFLFVINVRKRSVPFQVLLNVIVNDTRRAVDIQWLTTLKLRFLHAKKI